MSKKQPSNPMIEPVLAAVVGFDLFGPNHGLMTVHFFEDIENIHGPQQSARFIFQADQMKATGAMSSCRAMARGRGAAEAVRTPPVSNVAVTRYRLVAYPMVC